MNDSHPNQAPAKIKNKNTAGLLAIFLGIFGAHRFYIGRKDGVMYIILSVIGLFPIVFIMSVCEGVGYIVISEEKWNKILVPELPAEKEIKRAKFRKKIRYVLNTLIIGSILLILYLIAGHDFVKFYSGGETEILEAAVHINKLCNTNGSCPTTLEGWQPGTNGGETQYRGNMLYFVIPGEMSNDSDKDKKYQEFRLVYQFFMPDEWFEVKGGVDKPVTADWVNR